MRFDPQRLKAFVDLHGFCHVARLSGVPEATLATWLNGTREPLVNQLAKVTHAMGLPMDAMLTNIA